MLTRPIHLSQWSTLSVKRSSRLSKLKQEEVHAIRQNALSNHSWYWELIWMRYRRCEQYHLNSHIWTRWCDVDVIYDVWDRLRSRTIAPWPSTNTTQHIAYYRQYCILHITGFNRNWSSRNRNYKLWSRWIITTRCRTNFLLFDFVPIVLHHNLLNWV